MRAAAAAALAAGGSIAAAAIGGFGARNAPAIYERLDKPRWAPPAPAFGPVWTGLYTTMGVAAFRLVRRSARLPLGLHVTQLACNGAWPALFFSAGNKGLSLGVIAALDALVAAEIVVAAREDPWAAALLAPYLAWSLFATALNATVSAPSPA